MICKTCKDKIPDDKLACPRCLVARYEKEMLANQRQYFPAILRNAVDLTMVYTPTNERGNRGWHIQLIGDPSHAFCGCELVAGLKRDRILYRNMQTTALPCIRCQEVFDQMAEEFKTTTRAVGPIPIRERLSCFD